MSHISKTGTTSDCYLMNYGVENFVGNGKTARGAFTDSWRYSRGSKFKAQCVFVFDLKPGRFRQAFCTQ